MPARAQGGGAAFAIGLRAGNDDTHDSTEQTGRSLALDKAPGFDADLDGVRTRPARPMFARRFTVWVSKQAAKVNRVARQIGMTADRHFAGAAELGQESALASNLGRCISVIDTHQQLARARVVLARLDADGTLPGRGEKFVHTQNLGRMVCEAEPFQPCERKNSGIAFPDGELA